MAKFNGGYGGMGNMQNLMRQAQKMQEKIQEAQEELEEMELVGTSGSGMVEATVTGKKAIVSIKIKPEAVDPDDVEMLEDLIVAALNDAFSQADAVSEELLGPLTGGMGGLF
ncbi:MAG: YbaB/EbfC family nucleoid-associated protein [Clostridia bacterium]|nr:YbaB/EbfC family nucleoid-associated protein [Clostridia bacterium]